MLATFFLLPTWAQWSFFTLLCLILASFLNVVIYRLPKMLFAETDLNSSADFKKINLFFPRSFCPHCKKKIPAWANIPLFSYLMLQQRCYCCHKPIAFRYFINELLFTCLCLLAAYYFDFTPTLLFVIAFIAIGLCLCWIDWFHYLIPDSLSLGLLWLGLIANTHDLFTPLPNAVLSAALAYIAVWLFIQLYFFITGKIGMGHGDFKLFSALGAWFGWTQLPFLLLLASSLGVIVGFSYLKIMKKPAQTPIPFGPFLIFSGLICLFNNHA